MVALVWFFGARHEVGGCPLRRGHVRRITVNIRSLNTYSTTPITGMARPARVPAPTHPLADSDGLVPAEVFDLPPELLSAIRGLPIRTLEVPAPASPNAAATPAAPRLRPLDAPTFELEL